MMPVWPASMSSYVQTSKLCIQPILVGGLVASSLSAALLNVCSLGSQLQFQLSHLTVYLFLCRFICRWLPLLQLTVPFNLPACSSQVSLPGRVRLLAQKGREAGVWASPQSAAYWTYHIGRSGLLALQGVAGGISRLLDDEMMPLMDCIHDAHALHHFLSGRHLCSFAMHPGHLANDPHLCSVAEQATMILPAPSEHRHRLRS